MNHVRQKHANGCVIACLSMITGIPYDEIIPEFYGDRSKVGISDFQWDVWLAQKGYAIARKYKHYGVQHADRIVWPCEPFADAHICQVQFANGSHAIVLLRDGIVLDPNSDVLGKLSDYPSINNICGVWKVGEPAPLGPLAYLHWSDGAGKCGHCGAANDSYKYHDPCPARNL